MVLREGLNSSTLAVYKYRKVCVVAGEIVQWTEHLPCKCEDQSSDPQHPCECWWAWEMVGSPSAISALSRQRLGSPQSKLPSQTSQITELWVQLRGLAPWVRKMMKEDTQCQPLASHTCEHHPHMHYTAHTHADAKLGWGEKYDQNTYLFFYLYITTEI